MIRKSMLSCYHWCLGKCGNSELLKFTGALSEQENDPKITVVHTKNLKVLLTVWLMSPWNDRLELRVGELLSS